MLEPALTRSKIQPGGLVSTQTDDPDGTGGTAHWDILYFNPSIEVLKEIRSPDEAGSRKVWKSFEHYKSSVAIQTSMNSAQLSFPPLYQNIENAVASIDAPYALLANSSFGDQGRNGIPAFIIPFAGNTGFIPAPAEINELISGSLQSLLPNIRPQLSTVNSTIELKDFKTVPGTIKNILKLPRGVLRKGRNFKRIIDILRVAADVYLQLKFNIQPLLSDVNGIYRALAKTERRLNDLISRAGKLQTRHYMKSLNEYEDSDEERGPRVALTYTTQGSEGQFYSSTAVDQRVIVYSPSTFHAQIQYNYHYTDYQLEHARVLALLDAFGVNLNPAIIWNAIPWSFVVDWLVDVSRWLGTQRLGHMDPKTNIMQYLWSVKRSRTIYCRSKITASKYYSGSGLTGFLTPSSITHPVAVETAYKRVAGLPSASWLTTSGLSSTEFSLGAALVISRRRRRT